MLTFLDRLLPLMGRLARRSDLAAPVFVMIVLVVMVLPLPAFMLDLLIVLNITLSLIILIPLLSLVGRTAGAAGSYVVIVNTANPTTTLSRDAVARIFLKRATVWPNGKSATPVDLADTSAVRAAFSKAVLSRDVAAVKGFWQGAIFSGRAVPPAERPSEAAVVDFVRSNPYAVGYVSPATPLGEGVRALVIEN